MKEPMPITITAGTIIKMLFWVALAFGLFYVRDFVVALLVAVVLASSIELPVKFFTKIGIPRSLAVSGIFLTLVGGIAAVAFIFIPPLADDFARFMKTLPQILDSVRIFGKDMGFKDLSMALADLSKDISKGQILTIIKNAIFGSNGFFATTSVVLGSVFNFLLTFIMAFYLALEERGVQKFLRFTVPRSYEGYVEDLWGRAQAKISLWLQGQVLLSLLVAMLVYVAMLALKIPYASLVAVLAFVGELIPMVGLTLAMVPGLFLAWTHGGGQLLLIAAIIFTIIAQLESHVLYPKVMSKMVGVPSVLVIIAIVIGAKLGGIWGVLLAVPISAVIMELVSDIDKGKIHA
jgi:predicted PurR-regulated permease PerM